MKIKTSSIILVILLAGCVSNPFKTEDKKVRILLNTKESDTGILVKAISPVLVTGKNKGEVRIAITNFLDEEVFIEIIDPTEIGYNFCKIDSKGEIIEFPEGRNESVIMFPDNTHKLKRLHSAFRGKNGQRLTCACGVLFLTFKLNIKTIDLKNWIGAYIKVSLPVNGYLRRNGKYFGKTVNLLIQITKDQPKDALNSDSAVAKPE